MVVKNLILLAALSISGCATFDTINDLVGLDEESQDPEVSQNIGNGSASSTSASFQNPLKQKFQQQQQQQQQQRSIQNPIALDTPHTEEAKHNINYYVRGLMQDLVANLQYVNSTTPVAVVSFVMLDSNYNDSNLLGIQIAESLMHEVHKFGIPVIDFKTTGYIRITEQGDFAFSKDYQDFSGNMPARYIAGGTMLKQTDGYLINARIVGIQSQAVVASAQMFIPNSVSDPILEMSANTNSLEQQSILEVGSMNKTAGLPLVKNVFLIQE